MVIAVAIAIAIAIAIYNDSDNDFGVHDRGTGIEEKRTEGGPIVESRRGEGRAVAACCFRFASYYLFLLASC